VAQDGAAVIELILAKHAEREEEQQRWTSVRSELLSLRPRALQKRAEAVGVAEGDLDRATGDAAIVELILGRLQLSRAVAEDGARRLEQTQCAVSGAMFLSDLAAG
jgi:hypothetical protein